MFAPHEKTMTFNEFDLYCESNARPGVSPLSIIDELYERGLLSADLFLRYMMYAQRIYFDNLSIVIDANKSNSAVTNDDLTGRLEQ